MIVIIIWMNFKCDLKIKPKKKNESNSTGSINDRKKNKFHHLAREPHRTLLLLLSVFRSGFFFQNLNECKLSFPSRAWKTIMMKSKLMFIHNQDTTYTHEITKKFLFHVVQLRLLEISARFLFVPFLNFALTTVCSALFFACTQHTHFFFWSVCNVQFSRQTFFLLFFSSFSFFLAFLLYFTFIVDFV